MTAADPPPPVADPAPPLAPPLMYARFLCPGCGRLRRFETRPAMYGDEKALTCQCHRVLGEVVVDGQGWTLLRLAAV